MYMCKCLDHIHTFLKKMLPKKCKNKSRTDARTGALRATMQNNRNALVFTSVRLLFAILWGHTRTFLRKASFKKMQNKSRTDARTGALRSNLRNDRNALVFTS